MADVTELKCWPACLHGLDWSPDCIIALASDEQVELLFPNTESYDSDREIAQWRHFALQVPWFTKEELPVKVSGPLQTYSIGEEISSSSTCAIAWSPPGLAKHRRCALAALTANLVLSIWTSDGRPQVQASWGRRLIINDALEDYFSTIGSDDVSSITEDDNEKRRLRRRIRTFAWAPSANASTGIVGTQQSWGQYLVAVANDDNQVVIIAVESPTSSNGAQEDWSSAVMEVISATPSSEDIARDPFDFEEVIHQQRSVSHLAWGPWIINGTKRTSLLAYTTNNGVCIRAITCSDETHNIELGEETVFPNIDTRYSGPIKWIPRIGKDGKQTLAVFTNAEVMCLSFTCNDVSIVNQAIYPRDKGWDMISGVSWDIYGTDAPRLHFSGHLMSTRNPTAALQLSLKGLHTIDIEAWPYWRDQISGSEGHFSTSNDLKGHANAKVWGLSTSPLRDFMAACHTVHPTDMIEYGTPHDRRATISISHLWGKGAPLYFPPESITAEGIFFTIRRWIEYNIETPDDLPSIREDLHRKLISAYGSPVQPTPRTENPLPPSSNLRSTALTSLITTLKSNTLLNPLTINDRLETLTSLICNPTDPIDLTRTTIAYRLSSYLQQHLSLQNLTPFSKKVLSSNARVTSFVNDVLLSSSPNPNPNSSPSTSTSASTSTSNPPGTETNFTEPCTFCTSPIPFRDLTSASCDQGHEFQRCGLSFLVVEGPGCAKYCGLCGTPFLSEGVVFGGGVGSGGDAGGAERGGNEGGDDQDGNANVDVEMRDGDAVLDEAGEGSRGEEMDLANAGGGGENESPAAAAAAAAPPPPQTKGELQKPEGGKATEDTAADVGSWSRGDGSVDFARALFLACDVCVYCGGKFVG